LLSRLLKLIVDTIVTLAVPDIVGLVEGGPVGEVLGCAD
jgi:hypothetical protein